jgi:small subunit ribosomal protein S6
MSEDKMPAAEANSYELAFHVLPTVAEGEVATVFESLKDAITKHGGTVTNEEAPARIDLAYEIVKYLEGRNRKFTSAYFGWVRFEAPAEAIDEITEALEHTKELLRHLLVKLTKAEEAHPFFYHEAMAAEKRSETVEIDAETAEVEAKEEAAETDAKDEEAPETEVEKSEDAPEAADEAKGEVKESEEKA